MNAADNTSDSVKAAARGRIVNYADAHPELRREMENVMESIDRNPESMETVQAYGRPVQEQLDDFLNQMSLVTARNPLSAEALRQAMRDAEKLGMHRIDVTRDISLLLGASTEVMRRYSEEYIPEAEKKIREDNEPEDALYLKDLLRRKEDFMDRVTELEKARFDSINAGTSLRNRMEEWEAIRASGTLESKITIFRRPLQLKTAP